MNESIIVWAEGKTQDAIVIDVKQGEALDIETAADLLGCTFEEVNQCSPGSMSAYGVSFATL